MTKERSPTPESRDQPVASVSPSDVVSRREAPNTITQATLVPRRMTPDERRFHISIAAYQRAARRGFEPGYDVEDWLEAEKEVDAMEGTN